MRLGWGGIGRPTSVALLGVGALLALRASGLAAGFGLNSAAAAAARACASEARVASPAPAAVSAREGWLAGAVWRCADAPDEARAAWARALRQPEAWLPLLRTAAPADARLATEAASQQPGEAQAYLWLGGALAQSGEDVLAVNTLAHALTLAPHNAQAWYDLGRLYEAQGDPPAAARAFEQACHQVDRGHNSCPAAGRLHLALGEPALAEAAYRETIAQLPGWAPGHRGLATALLTQRKWDEARTVLLRLAETGDAWAQTKLLELEQLADEQ